MSDPSQPASNTPKQDSGASNPAQEAFGKYKSRLAAMPMMPGWGMPPSMGALPGFPFGREGQQQPHATGSLTERLGMTLRLGIDLLNAGLASGASALGGATTRDWGSHDGGCGCACEHHGYDCCAVMSCNCHPGAHGCGCGCC